MINSSTRTTAALRARWVVVPTAIAALALSGCATTSGSAVAAPGAAASLSAASSVAASPNAAPSSVPPVAGSASASTAAPSPDPGTSTTAGASSSSSSVGPAGSSLDAKTLVARMQAAAAKVTSATGVLSVTGTAGVDGTFAEKLSGGKVVAYDMTMTVKGSGQDISFEMRLIDGKAYLGGSILTELGAGNKKWALISTTSSNAGIRTMANAMSGYLDSANAAQYNAYAQAATSITDEGTTTVGSIPAHQYKLEVDVAALAKSISGSSATSMKTLAGSGIKSIPVTLALDSSDRVVDAKSSIAVSGVTEDTDFKITAYDGPVSIDAPAAADVYTG